MKGITYLRDEQNRLKAVQIDAELYGDVLQDFLDGLEAEQLKQEPKKKFDQVATRILAKKSTADVGNSDYRNGRKDARQIACSGC